MELKDTTQDKTLVEARKQLLNQLPPPLEKIIGTKGKIDLIVSDGKVVKYDIGAMTIWRAVVMIPYTMLAEYDTWYFLCWLCCICFATMFVVWFTGSSYSLEDDFNVTTRVQYLLSFVLAGYVTLSVGRWDKLRNDCFGGLWGSVENLTIYSYHVFNVRKDGFEAKCKDKVLRYSRLILALVFYAARAEDDLTELREMNLITEKEEVWLSATMVGTRPLMVITWIWKIFEKAKARGYDVPVEGRIFIIDKIAAARGGVGSTLGVLGCPYPFYYTHLIHWIVQMDLFILAVETGCVLMTHFSRLTGPGIPLDPFGKSVYTPDDDATPAIGPLWFLNFFLQIVVGNDIFALFALGLTKLCAKLQNPFSKDDVTSFPNLAYDKYIYNNMMAMRAGIEACDDIDEDEDEGDVQAAAVAAVAAAAAAAAATATTGKDSKQTGPEVTRAAVGGRSSRESTNLYFGIEGLNPIHVAPPTGSDPL